MTEWLVLGDCETRTGRLALAYAHGLITETEWLETTLVWRWIERRKLTGSQP